MRILSNIILAFEAVVAIYVLWLIYIYAKALWVLDPATIITIGFCLALYVFGWPDPNDRKINHKIKSPYTDGN